MTEIQNFEDLNELMRVRREKMAAIEEKGIEPFGRKYNFTHHALTILENFEDLEGQTVRLAGRLMTVRGHGKDVVSVGSTVILKDLEFGDELEYTLVGSAEADPAEAKISNESPVGQAILGQKVGSIVEVNVPVGILKYEIMDIR